jgi:AcrR family transcriptional regulator
MPRAGLNTAEVVASGAELADEAGIESVSLAALAGRLGVRAPALYKHVDGVGDLRRRIAILAMTELGDALREALQGKSGADAIGTLFTVVQSYIAKHPGRYDATTGAEFQGKDDPLLVAATRVIGSIRAVLSGYGIRPGELDHAIRMLRCTIHGYAMLRVADGFQWSNDPDESVAWMIRFFDAGLTTVGDNARKKTGGKGESRVQR